MTAIRPVLDGAVVGSVERTLGEANYAIIS